MKEACLIISKVARLASRDQILKLADLTVFETICDVLTDRDPLIVLRALDTIYAFLLHGEEILDEYGENRFIRSLDELRAIDKIENLQDFPSELVKKKVVSLLTRFFEVE